MRAAIYCLASAMLFGLAAPLCKSLVEELGAMPLAGLLYLGAALAVLPLSFKGSSSARMREGKHIMILLGAIVFGGVLGPVLLLLALARSDAGSVSLWLNLETVATAGLGALFFREQLGSRTWAAVACILAAGILLTGADPQARLVPALLVAGACLCWGMDNSLTALIDGLTPAQSTLAKGLVAGSVNLGLGLVLAEGLSLRFASVAQALAIGAGSYGLSIALYIQGAQDLGATRSQLIFSTAPFIGLAYAWSVLGEAVLTSQLMAGGLMLFGLGLLLGGRHGHEHRHDAIIHSHSHTHDDRHHSHQHEGLSAAHRHTHEHRHAPQTHSHEHLPDLHHRHEHG